MAIDIAELEKACRSYEEEHGLEGFLDAMAKIMERRALRLGLKLELVEDDANDELQHENR